MHMRRTCVSHDFARHFLVAAATAEDLTTDAAVMTSPEGRETVTTIIALLTVFIRHPVLTEVGVTIRLRCLIKTNTNSCT